MIGRRAPAAIANAADIADNSITASKIATGAINQLKLGLTYDNRTTATGDGSTTGFTIAADRTVNDILVIVNGITFVPTDDYDVVGTTLQFIAAPDASAEIAIRYLPK